MKYFFKFYKDTLQFFRITHFKNFNFANFKGNHFYFIYYFLFLRRVKSTIDIFHRIIYQSVLLIDMILLYTSQKKFIFVKFFKIFYDRNLQNSDSIIVWKVLFEHFFLTFQLHLYLEKKRRWNILYIILTLRGKMYCERWILQTFWIGKNGTLWNLFFLSIVERLFYKCRIILHYFRRKIGDFFYETNI